MLAVQPYLSSITDAPPVASWNLAEEEEIHQKLSFDKDLIDRQDQSIFIAAILSIFELQFLTDDALLTSYYHSYPSPPPEYLC